MKCEHDLERIKEATGTQKAEYICRKCKTSFAYYGNHTVQETQDYVNKYYQEIDKRYRVG